LILLLRRLFEESHCLGSGFFYCRKMACFVLFKYINQNFLIFYDKRFPTSQDGFIHCLVIRFA